MPGANALGCECPPAPAFGRRLLLYFAPKGIRPWRPVTCGLAFNSVRRESKNEGRHMDGPEGWNRRSDKRREGKEGGSTCRSRWSRDHVKKIDKVYLKDRY